MSRKQDLNKFYQVEIKSNSSKLYYKTIASMLKKDIKRNPNILGVSSSTLYHFDWEKGYYTNDIVTIKRGFFDITKLSFIDNFQEGATGSFEFQISKSIISLIGLCAVLDIDLTKNILANDE